MKQQMIIRAGSIMCVRRLSRSFQQVICTRFQLGRLPIKTINVARCKNCHFGYELPLFVFAGRGRWLIELRPLCSLSWSCVFIITIILPIQTLSRDITSNSKTQIQSTFAVKLMKQTRPMRSQSGKRTEKTERRIQIQLVAWKCY